MTFVVDSSEDDIDADEQAYQEWLELANHPYSQEHARRNPDKHLKNVIEGLQKRGHPEWLERHGCSTLDICEA